ncbi:MAG: hypothetical protein K8F91_14815 [Candidatus Obscuribacterales bacterium]|nr:hypothetical protein [Candidatus Obscuribacterales bacterium]
MNKLGKIYVSIALAVCVALVFAAFSLRSPAPELLGANSEQKPLSGSVDKGPKKRTARKRQAELEAARALSKSNEAGTTGKDTTRVESSSSTNIRLTTWPETKVLNGGVKASISTFSQSEYLVVRVELTGDQKAINRLRKEHPVLLVRVKSADGKEALEIPVRESNLIVTNGLAGGKALSSLMAVPCSAQVYQSLKHWEMELK